ncbi:KR domain-containing protein [Streptomyces sp. URMC 126]|uniref:KR domain-containing protein n=1 Tax=Streptomyces sp. URMC 126 TaxID=3423401 RepID=UPI003F1D4C85
MPNWLAGLGARHLALVGRRGPEAPESADLLDRLKCRGVTATAYAADVTDEAAIRRVLDAVDATGHPLRGVVHNAMRLDDAPLTELSERRALRRRPRPRGGRRRRLAPPHRRP